MIFSDIPNYSVSEEAQKEIDQKNMILQKRTSGIFCSFKSFTYFQYHFGNVFLFCQGRKKEIEGQLLMAAICSRVKRKWALKLERERPQNGLLLL